MKEFKSLNGYHVKDETARNEIKDIKNEIKFHAISKSSAVYITQFPNGKNMIIDTGLSTEWEDIKKGIDRLGITKFDYMIITHFHEDHIGNIENLVNEYDFSDCVCWVGMKPDFINHADDIEETEEEYDNGINKLKLLYIDPVVPENDSFYEIDKNTKLHFLNTSVELAEDYYFSYGEYRDVVKTNFNNFSLVTEIIYKDTNILVTGDIETPAEKVVTPFLSKCDIMTAPHHGINKDAYKPFYYATMPDYALAMYQTDSDEWVQIGYKSFRYLRMINAKLITARWSSAVDGLFSFSSNGKNVKTNVLDSGISENCFNEPTVYAHLEEVINFTKQIKQTITLEEIFENMAPGSRLITTWWDSYNEVFENLYEEIIEIFPNFKANMVLELEKDATLYKSIKVSSPEVEYKAVSQFDTINWIKSGNGKLEDITGNTNLINKILTLPIGSYKVNYKDDEGSVLTTEGFYSLDINVMSEWNDVRTAIIFGVLRDSNNASSDVCRVVAGYVNTSSDKKYVWFKINN